MQCNTMQCNAMQCDAFTPDKPTAAAKAAYFLEHRPLILLQRKAHTGPLSGILCQLENACRHMENRGIIHPLVNESVIFHVHTSSAKLAKGP